MNETVENTEGGAILYDRALINQISDADFQAATWPSATPVSGSLRTAGRGRTMVLCDGNTEFVLRHYRRGGLPGRFNRDRYLWLGQERTRAFAEWRLLARMIEMNLPVPRPAAARYCRVAAFFYTADLLTVRQPGIRSLSDRLLQDAPDGGFWQRLGRGIRRFHQHGVFHADLNAYNLQVDAADELFILDFDRGRLRPPGSWQQRNLARLYRSLRKIRQMEPRINFSEDAWRQLLQGYSSASRSA
ncbi:MAG: 3-deoxy-D-manno-octulosonic acid kinase [Woeseia sp.]